MAEKKFWHLRWKRPNGEICNIVYHQGGEGVTLKTMYDKINEWHGRSVRGIGDGCLYMIVGAVDDRHVDVQEGDHG